LLARQVMCDDGGAAAPLVDGAAVSVTLPIPVIQGLQVITIAVGAPGVNGVIARVEARLQGRRGPRVLQPYYDLAKLFGKESLAPQGAGPFFLLAPLLSFACYLTVPLLIPVLTSYALPLGYMGDILGGGFILALASFVVAVGAAESGGPYAQLGSSRAKTFAAITEPVVLLVVFSVALVTTTDLPYVLGATVRSGPDQIVRPAHLLASAALFMVILFETGRIPVETHTGTIEFGMIEEARGFEHSGPYFALLRWGSAAKQLVLYTILINVFLAPWGLSSTTRADQVGLAIASLLAKAVAVGCAVAVIDDSFAKLRLFKITEFVAGAFLLAVLGVFTLYLGGG
jgi:formate hydrogenlyase subunit 4